MYFIFLINVAKGTCHYLLNVALIIRPLLSLISAFERLVQPIYQNTYYLTAALAVPTHADSTAFIRPGFEMSASEISASTPNIMELSDI